MLLRATRRVCRTLGRPVQRLSYSSRYDRRRFYDNYLDDHIKEILTKKYELEIEEQLNKDPNLMKEIINNIKEGNGQRRVIHDEIFIEVTDQIILIQDSKAES